MPVIYIITSRDEQPPASNKRPAPLWHPDQPPTKRVCRIPDKERNVEQVVWACPEKLVVKKPRGASKAAEKPKVEKKGYEGDEGGEKMDCGK